LNDHGIQEANALRQILADIPFDRAFAGNSRRCRQTLEIIIGQRNIPIEIDHLMNEIDYGDWEGLTKGDVVTRFAEDWKRFEENPDNVPPNGESVKSCAERVESWLTKLQCNRGLAVVDKTWLRLLICSIMGAPITRYRQCLDAKIASITVLLLVSKSWRMETLNYGATRKRVFGIDV